MKKLLPLVLILIGSGAGIGAGLFLRPAPVSNPEHMSDASGDTHLQADAPHADSEKRKSADGEGPATDESFEYAKLANQFVIPVVYNKRIGALVVVKLSLETVVGKSDLVLSKEPKLRDAFLQVMFDHANIGGFEGAFTDAGTLDILRRGLREIAQKIMGPGVVNDVLILEIARQDY
ncbi:MAG: flagellar basal body-associated protein FliL [Sulfitobacter sp.]